MTESSKKAMEMLAEGGIHNHMLSNAAGIHTGEEERNEMTSFRDYLITKNGCLVMAVEGSGYCG